MLASWELGGGADFPISRFLISDARLHATPLVLTFNERLVPLLLGAQNSFSRIDAYLVKPFNSNTLGNAVERAFERRASMRKTLVLLGDQFRDPIGECVMAASAGSHWTQLEIAQDFTQLEKIVGERGLNIGAIVVDPASFSTQDWSWLHRFRKTRQGASTGIVCLSRDPQLILPLRSQADWFVSPASTQDMDAWHRWLHALSSRVVQQYRFQKEMLWAQGALKKREFKVVKETIKKMQTLGMWRWEIDELRGKLFQAQGYSHRSVGAYQQALLGNPCSVRSHLGILTQVEASVHEAAAKTALEYCPDHPDIRKKAEEHAS